MSSIRNNDNTPQDVLLLANRQKERDRKREQFRKDPFKKLWNNVRKAANRKVASQKISFFDAFRVVLSERPNLTEEETLELQKRRDNYISHFVKDTNDTITTPSNSLDGFQAVLARRARLVSCIYSLIISKQSHRAMKLLTNPHNVCDLLIDFSSSKSTIMNLRQFCSYVTRRTSRDLATIDCLMKFTKAAQNSEIGLFRVVCSIVMLTAETPRTGLNGLLRTAGSLNQELDRMVKVVGEFIVGDEAGLEQRKCYQVMSGIQEDFIWICVQEFTKLIWGEGWDKKFQKLSVQKSSVSATYSECSEEDWDY